MVYEIFWSEMPLGNISLTDGVENFVLFCYTPSVSSRFMPSGHHRA